MPATLTDRDSTQNKNRKLLNTAGLRNTTQRTLILDIIRRGQGGHLDADEVHRQAKRKQPPLSLSTVYRTLQKLKGLGLIEELHFTEQHHHYEIKPRTHHHHLECLGCGKITEFKYPLAQLVKKKVSKAKDFDITGSEVRMTGYCADCQESKK